MHRAGAAVLPPASSHQQAMRCLCSHLVRIIRPGDPGNDTTGLLEEISETEALLSAEAPAEAGDRIAFEADGFKAWARVTSCTLREDNYAIVCAFDPDWRWNPHHWRPDHLYRPEPHKKAAGSN